MLLIEEFQCLTCCQLLSVYFTLKFVVLKRDPAVRKEFLPIRAQLLTAKYGSPAYSDQG